MRRVVMMAVRRAPSQRLWAAVRVEETGVRLKGEAGGDEGGVMMFSVGKVFAGSGAICGSAGVLERMTAGVEGSGVYGAGFCTAGTVAGTGGGVTGAAGEVVGWGTGVVLTGLGECVVFVGLGEGEVFVGLGAGMTAAGERAMAVFSCAGRAGAAAAVAVRVMVRAVVLSGVCRVSGMVTPCASRVPSLHVVPAA